MEDVTLFQKRFARYGLTLSVLGLVLVKVHPERLGASISAVRPLDLIIACVLTLPFLSLKALRWHLLLLAGRIETTFWESALSYVGGMGLALITPARLGELARAAYLTDSRKLKIGGLVMIDKAFDVWVLAGLSAVGAWRLLGPVPCIALAAVASAGFLVAYFPGGLSRSLMSLTARLPWSAKIGNIVSSAESLTPGSTTMFLLLTLAAFAVVMLQFGFILSSWHPWSLDVVLLTFPIVILTNVLPLTIGGLGVREGAAALLLSHYGVPASEATVTALLSATVNTYIPGIAGAMLFPIASARKASARLRSLDRT
ncbi:MAG: hypothetical protein NVSMB22_14430 [Chloroflexota bacterium]